VLRASGCSSPHFTWELVCHPLSKHSFFYFEFPPPSLLKAGGFFGFFFLLFFLQFDRYTIVCNTGHLLSYLLILSPFLPPNKGRSGPLPPFLFIRQNVFSKFFFPFYILPQTSRPAECTSAFAFFLNRFPPFLCRNFSSLRSTVFSFPFLLRQTPSNFLPVVLTDLEVVVFPVDSFDSSFLISLLFLWLLSPPFHDQMWEDDVVFSPRSIQRTVFRSS